MKSIFSRFAFGLFIAIVILSALIITLVFSSLRSQYTEMYFRDLLRINKTLTHVVKPYVISKNIKSLDSVTTIIAKENETRITIILPDGKVISDTEKDPKFMDNHRYRKEIIEAEENGEGYIVRYSNTIQEDMLYTAIAIKEGTNIIGYSRVSYHMKGIRLLISNLTMKVITITLIILIISYLLIVLISRKFSNPIIQLVNASKKVAEGEFDVKVNINSKNEFKALGDAFNFMTGQINSLFKQVSIQKEQLNRIIKSIHGGLVVFDSKGKVVLSNEYFTDIVEYNKLEGKNYWEIIREKDIQTSIKSLLSNKTPIMTEVLFRNKYYLLSANWIDASQELVIILHDITELKKLEKVKRDFVINVSHELRTPLTAIKGFIENLEESVEHEDNKRYVEIIKRHTDRLINIVQDLQILSSMEDNQIQLEIVDVDIKNLVQNVLMIFEPRLEEKKLKLEILISDDIIPIQADEFKLEQVFVNLIDNAVKYSDNGKIIISASQSNDNLIVSVEDTGLGISDEDRERIFERFYTVDKSRSRKMGGTGLGLSIVKHIILKHSGKIEVESIQGKGSKFTITLPNTNKFST